MGQGMALVTPNPADVIVIAREHNIEAKIIGDIREEPVVRIRSRGLNAGKKSQLVYSIE